MKYDVIEHKIFYNDLEIIYLQSLFAGSNNIKVLRKTLSFISNETFAKITQSLYFRMIINIKNDEIIIDYKMKTLVDYLISRKIKKIDKSNDNIKQNIIYQVKRLNSIDVTRELIILFS